MEHPIVIIKLGGSVITRKDQDLLEVRQGQLRRLCRELGQAQRQGGLRLVLVHGAGPFGHKVVARYGINDGLRSARDVEGFVRTHNSMEDLDYQVMCALREADLLGYPVPPGAIVAQDRRRIEAFWGHNVRRLLALDPRIIPVLYGDMVPDRTLGGSVVSGDALVARLARELGAARVCLGTDVDGVFDRDPKLHPRARPFRRLDPGDLDRAVAAAGRAQTTDVTGGMHKKLREIQDNLAALREAGVQQVCIYDALAPDRTRRALLGEAVGTCLITA